jgi:hypothetical protein
VVLRKNYGMDLEIKRPSTGERCVESYFCVVCGTKKPNIYQDRLGTNVGKLEHKSLLLQGGARGDAGLPRPLPVRLQRPGGGLGGES